MFRFLSVTTGHVRWADGVALDDGADGIEV
jgi:hypothetical protein